MSEAIKKTLFQSKMHLLVYGPGHVGKTALICEALKESKHDVIWYECVRESFDYNVELLTREAMRMLEELYLGSVRDF